MTVGAGGTLLATGDLGEGADVLDVAGTLDVGGGTFPLGDGNDNFIVHDSTVVTGTVDGGAGFDTRTYDINTTAIVGALVNFEGVTKTGTGVLNITGPGATDCAVDVLGGTLNIGPSGSVVAPAAHARHAGRRGRHAECRGQLRLRRRQRHHDGLRHRVRAAARSTCAAARTR